jgi:hypothetical protein
MIKGLTVVFGTLVLLFAAFLLFMKYSEFGKQDRCLDNGGVWKDGVCIGNRSNLTSANGIKQSSG